MKNRILSFFLMMICFVASCFVSCGNFNGGSSDNSGNSGDNGSGTNDNGTNVTITETSISIWLTSYPDKVYYQVNEPFDSTGLAIESTIIEKYSDGTENTFTEEIVCPNENITFSGTDFSTVGTKNITVIYTKNEMTAYTSFEVNVGEGSLILNTFDSISIKTLPTKTEYKVNEEFDPTGLEITAIYTNYYSDNSTMSYSNDISYDNNMTFSGTDFSTVGTKTITVTYTENETSQFATFQITVKAAAFSSIINYTTFDSEINSDLSIYNGKAMTLYLDTTTVNIATLYTQFTTLLDAVKAGSVKIDFADAGKTTIEGELFLGNINEKEEMYAPIKAFTKALVSKEGELPELAISYSANSANFYKTGLGDLLNLYYDKKEASKLNNFEVSGFSSYFDAVDYLNRDERGDLKGKAYDNQEEYIEDSYYNLNVNAALLMNGTALKNVNVTGTLEQNAEFASELTNVRFNVDSNGKKFTTGVNGIGLIEFAGDAPSMTPRVNSGRIVLKNATTSVDFQGGFSIDVSKISDEADIHNNINHSTAGFVEVIYPTQATADSTKFTPSSIRVGNDLVFGNDYYATNQQWIDAANKNEWIEEGKIKYPNKAKLVSKLNLDEKNNNKLLNTILFNNQKVYG